LLFKISVNRSPLCCVLIRLVRRVSCYRSICSHSCTSKTSAISWSYISPGLRELFWLTMLLEGLFKIIWSLIMFSKHSKTLLIHHSW